LVAALADRYRIERELGQGGMATVYLAQDLKHDRKVALKVLKPELAAVIGAERFVVEIKTTAALQHPHILPLFDSGTADSFLYYVMPFIDGETLRSKLDRETQLGIDESVKITMAVADALDYAHRHGVVHRDIKPENILLHDGRPMVADFGIALALSAAAGGRMTETGMSLGTPHYMSPEQATAEKEITARSDVYSLGSVLYEMLTGNPPHVGASAQQIIMKIVTEEAAPVTKLRKAVPQNVADAVAKSLEKLPADRFATAAEFAAALGNASFTIAGGPATGVTGLAGRTGVSRRALAALAALGAVLLVAALWGWLRRPTPPGTSRYQVLIRSATLPPGVMGRNLALSPDGKAFVFADTIGGLQLWIKEEDRAEAVPLTGTARGFAPRFSPDGEWVAFIAENKLKKVPRVGGSAVTLGDSAGNSIAWLDDGLLLYRGAQASSMSLRAVSSDGVVVREWHDSLFHGAVVTHLDGLPGGRGALVSLCNPGCTESRLIALDMRSGAMHEVMGDVLSAWSVRDDRVVFVRPDGGVFAGAFDADDYRFRSPPVPVLEGVRVGGNTPDFVVARTGTALYVTGESSIGGALVQTVWVTREGVSSLIDTSWSWRQLVGSNGLALSPDGRQLAVSINETSGQNIWVKQLDAGPLTRLSFEKRTIRPVWSADGRYLWYGSNDSTGLRLLQRRADGTASPEPILDPTGDVEEVVETRDTAVMIVRLTVPGGGRQIFLFRRAAGTGDSALSPLLAAPGYDQKSPALSPDGRWLAYTSNESGRNEVYVRPFPDVDAGRWQVSRNGGIEPMWSHSGRELFFRSQGPRTFVAVPILANAGTGFQMGEQLALFDDPYFRDQYHAQYAVSPDDRRFVFKRLAGDGFEPGSSAPAIAILVQHWLAELDLSRPAGR
ncbi:MAG TPA: protein kinase, partial [Gemmatimonadales bacterium]|nr:protein kinase [Gemmatimonadales bacterium]